MSMPFAKLSAREARARIGSGELSAVELTRAALNAAQRTQASLNAFSVLFEDQAMAAAYDAEAAVKRGDTLGPLHGVPFSAKDLMAVKDAPYTFGSRAMADNVATVDAPAVERAKAAGGILIGKTTTSEFGCKAVGDSPLTGITRNPWDLAKTPGGSSAGAAASVAAGIAPLALGTDGGGSIRIPCAFTGLAGLKGQFGRVPAWPIPATPTLAHVGPIARDIADVALMYSVIAGYDERDPFSVAGPTPDLDSALGASIEGMKIAWSPTLGYARPDPDVLRVTEAAVARLCELGAIVEQVDTVFGTDPVAMWMAEFYVGVGTRLRSVVEEQPDLLDPAVAVALETALGQDMRAYYETVFQRYALREEMRRFFGRYDALLSPVLPVTSLDTGVDVPAHLSDRNILSWVFYTYPFNLTGQPAASICAGLDAAGMPVGLQIVGRAHGEADVVRIAAGVERVREPFDLLPPDLLPQTSGQL